jgi:hypothetical protein
LSRETPSAHRSGRDARQGELREVPWASGRR